jgi:hypothetical protein
MSEPFYKPIVIMRTKYERSVIIEDFCNPNNWRCKLQKQTKPTENDNDKGKYTLITSDKSSGKVLAKRLISEETLEKMITTRNIKVCHPLWTYEKIFESGIFRKINGTDGTERMMRLQHLDLASELRYFEFPETI